MKRDNCWVAAGKTLFSLQKHLERLLKNNSDKKNLEKRLNFKHITENLNLSVIWSREIIPNSTNKSKLKLIVQSLSHYYITTGGA